MVLLSVAALASILSKACRPHARPAQQARTAPAAPQPAQRVQPTPTVPLARAPAPPALRTRGRLLDLEVVLQMWGTTILEAV